MKHAPIQRHSGMTLHGSSHRSINQIYDTLLSSPTQILSTEAYAWVPILTFAHATVSLTQRLAQSASVSHGAAQMPSSRYTTDLSLWLHHKRTNGRIIVVNTYGADNNPNGNTANVKIFPSQTNPRYVS